MCSISLISSRAEATRNDVGRMERTEHSGMAGYECKARNHKIFWLLFLIIQIFMMDMLYIIIYWEKCEEKCFCLMNLHKFLRPLVAPDLHNNQRSVMCSHSEARRMNSRAACRTLKFASAHVLWTDSLTSHIVYILMNWGITTNLIKSSLNGENDDCAALNIPTDSFPRKVDCAKGWRGGCKKIWGKIPINIWKLNE